VKPEYVSASGLNSLTRNQVETFLNRWNATVWSVAANSVVFDTVIFDAIQSEGFWDRDVAGIVFTETDYDQATGVHTVEADYKNSPLLSSLPDATIERIVLSKGASIIAHPTNKITFAITRNTVFDVFKQEVKERTDGMYASRQFYFTQEAVNIALANGGSVAVTRQQALNYLHNRLDD